MTQFSPTSYRFIPLRSKYPPQHPVLKHPQSMLFPKCEIMDSTPVHNYRQNCSFVYYSIHMFIDSGQKEKYSELNGRKHSTNLVNTSFLHECILDFLLVFPKYLNFSTFSKDLLAVYMSRFSSILW
jgi:hypothetical protein